MTDPKAQDWKERLEKDFPLPKILAFSREGMKRDRLIAFIAQEIAAAEERGRQQGRQEISQQLYPGTIFRVAIAGEDIERGVTPVYFGDDGKVYKSKFPPL